METERVSLMGSLSTAKCNYYYYYYYYFAFKLILHSSKVILILRQTIRSENVALVFLADDDRLCEIKHSNQPTLRSLIHRFNAAKLSHWSKYLAAFSALAFSRMFFLSS